jgi:hypothetical protein
MRASCSVRQRLLVRGEREALVLLGLVGRLHLRQVDGDLGDLAGEIVRALNSGDTILISAAVPPVPLVGDMVWDAGGDHLGKARHGFSSPPPIIAPGDHVDGAPCRRFRTKCGRATTRGARGISTRCTGRRRSTTNGYGVTASPPAALIAKNWNPPPTKSSS